MKRTLPLVAILGLALLLPGLSARAEEARVVSTIRPLQLIVSEITDGMTLPDLLIPSSASYHHFTLRPSAMRSMNGAALVIWIGPSLESWLTDTIRQLPGRVEVITVAELEGITTLPLSRQAVIQEDNGHQSMMDPHLWLDSDNAVLIADAVAEVLSRRDPDNRASYQDNLRRFTASVEQADRAIGTRLEPLADRDYVVYHNSFQYFGQRYGLTPSLVFVQDEEIQPGIRQLLSVRRALAEQDPACLLLDATANADTIDTILGDRELARIVADPAGESVSPGPGSYRRLLDSLADSFVTCLSGQ